MQTIKVPQSHSRRLALLNSRVSNMFHFFTPFTSIKILALYQHFKRFDVKIRFFFFQRIQSNKVILKIVNRCDFILLQCLRLLCKYFPVFSAVIEQLGVVCSEHIGTVFGNAALHECTVCRQIAAIVQNGQEIRSGLYERIFQRQIVHSLYTDILGLYFGHRLDGFPILVGGLGSVFRFPTNKRYICNIQLAFAMMPSIMYSVLLAFLASSA